MNITGSKLKLARANRHIRDLENLFETFICENPHRIEVNKSTDGNGFNVSIIFDKDIPSESSTIIGDALHNMRSALDILASEAVRSNGNKPNFKTGFPIYKEESDFTRNIGKKLNGASERFITFVRGFETYAQGSFNLIYTLSKLNNLDKHECFVPTVTVFKLKNISIVDCNRNSFTLGEVTVSGQGKVSLINGISDIVQMDPGSDANIGVIFSHTGSLDGKEIISTLKSIHGCVSKIINDPVLVNI